MGLDKLKINCLLVEGVDKSGKDSVIEAFHKLTNYEWAIINRLWASIYVHGGFNNRNINYVNLFRLDEEYSKNGTVLVYVTADTKVIKERFKKHNEKDILDTDIKLIKRMFEMYLKETSMKIIRLDTSKCTPEESAEELFRKLIKLGYNGLIY